VSIVETRALTKRYPGVVALDTLDLELDRGIIGLVGANGAGKSTLIKILLGLLPPTSGSATMLGFDAASQAVELRQFVGYMPEHDCLPLDMTATEFVAHMAQVSGLPRAAARERTAETLRHVGLFEERYREMRGYSTGMRQRVKLAQALVHDPSIMLLDEPTNGLDPEGRDEMLDLVRKTGQEFGIAIIMSSHLLGEIQRVCDHLVVIEGGRLVESAPIAAFTRTTGVLTVELEGGAGVLVERLRAAGFEAREDGRLVLVGASEMPPYDLIRDTADDLGVGLVRIEAGRQSLEDLFREPLEVRDGAAV
jgi:ABC-2 type transport system ATP-binding protein